MRIVSWNVNGLRAILRKNFYASVETLQPDILCLQEIKVDKNSIPEITLPNYTMVFNSADRKGYAGTAILSKIPPKNLSCIDQLDSLFHPHEGRAMLAKYDNFSVVNVYVPNSGAELRRLDFRHKIWDPTLLNFVNAQKSDGPVILCGDMNVAHEAIDLAHPEVNHFSAGFTDEEREGMSSLLKTFGYDTFRYFYPEDKQCYSWWSYRMRARDRNVGWRIDYVIVDTCSIKKLKSAFICQDIIGSDHAPVGIDIDI